MSATAAPIASTSRVVSQLTYGAIFRAYSGGM
jgi:hypothetical protein